MPVKQKKISIKEPVIDRDTYDEYKANDMLAKAELAYAPLRFIPKYNIISDVIDFFFDLNPGAKIDNDLMHDVSYDKQYDTFANSNTIAYKTSKLLKKVKEVKKLINNPVINNPYTKKIIKGIKTIGISGDIYNTYSAIRNAYITNKELEYLDRNTNYKYHNEDIEKEYEQNINNPIHNPNTMGEYWSKFYNETHRVNQIKKQRKQTIKGNY